MESLESRQTYALKEVWAMFSRLRIRDVVDNLMEDYRGSRDATSFVVRKISGDPRRKWINIVKYENLLKAFFPIRADNHGTSGYKMWELADVLSAPWWLGTITTAEFGEVLKKNPNIAYVRRTAKSPALFIIGFDRGDGRGLEETEFRQPDRIIEAYGESYRTISELYYKFVAVTEGVQGLLPSHSFEPPKRPVMLPPRMFTSGKMDETVGDSKAYVNVGELSSSRKTIEEKQNWSQWL